MLNITLYFQPQNVMLAQYWQSFLEKLHVVVNLVEAAQINARFLRLHPEMALLVDDDGLWLAAQGMKIQPAWQDELHRLKRANTKNELIARACQITKAETILDTTAGLGHDGLLLAWLGAKVTLLERHPILYALLISNLQKIQQVKDFQQVIPRIEIIHAESTVFLKHIEYHQYDVIYLDPMFPQRDSHQKAEKKQAQVKKQMQLLHILLANDQDLGEELLPLAQQKSPRVIVKRPRHAVFLNQQTPQHQWQGDACRFDGYFG